jgi:hypothetical protein
MTAVYGHQTPRFNTGPAYEHSPGDEAIELARLADVHLDPWQQLVLRDSLGENGYGPDRKWAAFEVGLVVPRQSGKGECLLARELFGLFLEDREKLILHSAHEFKAVHVSTKVPTPTGWTTMGQVSAGDEVFDEQGNRCRVLAAHDVMSDRPCFEVVFSDGQTIIADSDHNWLTWDHNTRKTYAYERRDGAPPLPDNWTTWRPQGRPGTWTTGERMKVAELRDQGWTCKEIGDLIGRTTSAVLQQWNKEVVPIEPRARVRTTAEIASTLRVRANANHCIPLAKPLNLPETSLVMDGWVLGYLLGDGDTSGSGRVACHSDEREWLMSEFTRLGYPATPYSDPLHFGVRGVRQIWRQLELNKGKRIPEAYFRASTQQRLALLQGLIDSDGGVDHHGSYRFDNTNKTLVDGVFELAASLGLQPRIYSREPRLIRTGNMSAPSWVVVIPSTIPLARLPQKVQKARHAWRVEQISRFIVDVRPVPSVPVRCLTVDSPSHLYLVGDGFIPTHNTSVEAFNRIKERILGSDWLSRKMKGPPRTAHGEEGFELKNGSRLRFVARSSGSGRGFTCDCLILDEAFNLSDNAMAALLPTLQARPNPQIWYTSSAGMQSSETLRKVRTRGRRGDPRLRYFEWSCPEDADLDSPEAWAQANPALGYRLRMDGIASLRAAMNDDTFGREILGIWDEDNVQTMIDLRLWAELADPQSRPGNSLTFAVDVKPDRTAAAIASAGKRADGRLHTKIVDHREGVDWLVDRLRILNEKYHPRAIALDPAGPAGSLIADLAEVNIEPVLVTGREMAQACGAFHADVLNDRIRHTGQEALTSALRQATTRNLGDAWAWDRRDSRGDICPLVAATLATHGFRLHGNAETAQPWVMFG